VRDPGLTQPGAERGGQGPAQAVFARMREDQQYTHVRALVVEARRSILRPAAEAAGRKGGTAWVRSGCVSS
jgi:hypothetical protein